MDSRAQLCLGWALAMAKRYDRAANHMAQALRLNPQDPWTLVSAGLFHAFTGQHDAARALAEQARAMSFNPVPAHWVYHSAIAYLAGDDALAVEAAGRTLSAALPSRAWHAAALFNLGHEAEARQVAQGFLDAARQAWRAEEEPTDAAIGHWFLHLFPIAREADWRRLRDGAAGAGIPAASSRHHGW
jgi:tetratricopeptide (TPR) repeat protein